MTPPDALQVLLIAHIHDAKAGDFPRPESYVDAFRAAFTPWEVEESARDAALAEGEKTGAAVRWDFIHSTGEAPVLPPAVEELGKALHSLVIVIATPALARDATCVARLEALAAAVRDAPGRPHDFLLLGMNEAALSALRGLPGTEAISRRQGVSLERLGEYALRPHYAAMLALHRAHRLLAASAAGQGGAVSATARFFISHAKLDGLSLAHSMEHAIKSLPWLGSFYDARDIQPGDDWQETLEQGVRDSMLLALRTDAYDQRFWCRREVLWAERYDRPVLLVDARALLLARPSVLGFTGVPGVRIPDGNLVRVLAEALREWVRIGILRRRCAAAVAGSALAARAEFLSRTPTLASLAGALDRLAARQAPPDALIVHPEPPLESELSEAAQALIRSRFPQGAVLSLRTFFAQLS